MPTISPKCIETKTQKDNASSAKRAKKYREKTNDGSFMSTFN